MSEIVFQGASNLALDAKGRLSVPARHREALQLLCEGRLTVTRHPDGCLMLFPKATWEAFRDKLNQLPMSAVAWKRVFLGNAMDLEIDSASRVLISPELRKAAGLKNDVMLMGMGSHFELWDTEAHAAHEAKTMAGPMPEALQDFTF